MRHGAPDYVPVRNSASTYNYCGRPDRQNVMPGSHAEVHNVVMLFYHSSDVGASSLHYHELRQCHLPAPVLLARR